jgi:hypothetical protein
MHGGHHSEYMLRLINLINGNIYASWNAYTTNGYSMPYVERWQNEWEYIHTTGHMSGWQVHHYGTHVLEKGLDRIPFRLEGIGGREKITGIAASHFYVIPVE